MEPSPGFLGKLTLSTGSTEQKIRPGPLEAPAFHMRRKQKGSVLYADFIEVICLDFRSGNLDKWAVHEAVPVNYSHYKTYV